MVHIHPWELDPDQPRINSISRKSRFRHYVNLDKTESKFKKLLSDFRFSAISDVLNLSTAKPQHGSTKKGRLERSAPQVKRSSNQGEPKQLIKLYALCPMLYAF